ncbi:MAG: 2-dehydropantoate 2-reductase [Oscillospiraceae bacterium]|nr:2-dehydropantoate 2-reductase [Oscillospiraceae bacterium]
MKIAMVGSGAAGSVFAGYLRRGGADITLVDPYKEHMDKIAANGLTFVVNGDQTYQLTGFKTAYNADEIGTMDIVIFMTKTMQLNAALKGAMPCVGENTVLVSLMNGLGNEDKLVAAVGGGRVLYGNGVFGTELPEPGTCISSPSKDGLQMNFGAVERTELTVAAGEYLEKLFIDGGCPCKFWEDVAPHFWQKIITNCTFNPLSAILRMKCKDIFKDMNGAGLATGIVKECCEVATAWGCPMEASKFFADLVKTVGGGSIEDYYPSMAQDVLIFQRPTEIDTLNGAIVAYGKKFGVPTPCNDYITKTIKCIQKNYDKQYKS